MKPDQFSNIIFVLGVAFSMGGLLTVILDWNTDTKVIERHTCIGEHDYALSDKSVYDYIIGNVSFISTYVPSISMNKTLLKEMNLTCYYWENYTSLGLRCEAKR